MAQRALIKSSWPGGSRNRAGKLTLKFKDTADPNKKFDQGGVQYVVTPGERDFRETINVHACRLSDRVFIWQWVRTAGQNHEIAIAFTADSPQVGANDLDFDFADVTASFSVVSGGLEPAIEPPGEPVSPDDKKYN